MACFFLCHPKQKNKENSSHTSIRDRSLKTISLHKVFLFSIAMDSGKTGKRKIIGIYYFYLSSFVLAHRTVLQPKS